MHTLTLLGFLYLGAFALVVMFMEVRRKRHYIAYLFAHRRDLVRTTPRDLGEAIATGLLIVLAIVAFLVLS